MTKPQFLSIDFETRSTIDLRKTGLYKYAEHPTTDVWCMAYKVGDDPDVPVQVWHMDTPIPDDFIAASKTHYIRAWNAQFERIIWRDVLTARHGWEYPGDDHFVCSMVAAASAGLPMGLEDAAIALGLIEQKDMTGSRLMMQMTKPRRVEDDGTIVWWNDAGRRKRLAEYCAQDVRTECEAWSRLPPCMDKRERALYLLDQRINDRGVLLDAGLISGSRRLARSATAALNKELAGITGGVVTAVTQIEDLKTFIRAQGVPTTVLDKARIDELLDQEDLHPGVRRALEIRREAGKTSVRKFAKMAEVACADGRARGLLQFYGAGTGRWCLTGDHEVLTPDEGWVPLSEWEGGRIATWSPDGTCAFTKASRLGFEYRGPMLHHVNKRMDQVATPDHTVPIWDRKTGRLRPTKAGDLKTRFQFPYTGDLVSRPSGNLDHLRVLVMVQADGHYLPDGSVRLHFKKARKIERCKRLLRRALLPFVVNENACDGTTTLTVPRRCVPMWLVQFRDKTFGWWLLDTDLNVVFDELEHWDAYRAGPNSLQYSTINAQNADVIQAAAHLSGRAVSRKLKMHSSDDEEKWANSHVVSIWLTPSNRSEMRDEPTQEAFEGRVYCAETRTGFFLVRRNGKVWVTGNSGRQIQPQNFPRGSLKADDIEAAVAAVKKGSAKGVAEFGEPMEVLSSLLRGALIPTPGKVFHVADYAQIEARMVAWLAGEDELVNLFATGGKVYETMAARIFGVKVEDVTPEQRQVGKMVVLACGFGMGPVKFTAQAGVEPGLAEMAVRAYREQNSRIKDLWYGLDDVAIKCVKRRSTAPVTYKRLSFRIVGDWLAMGLPSGRSLWYHKPRIVEREVPWGGTRPAVEIDARNSVTRKWEPRAMYGGIWTENATQAVARDIMADGMTRTEAEGWRTLLSVHDEVIAETDADRDIDRFVSLLSVVPAWAKGCPIKAEGWSGERYRK